MNWQQHIEINSAIMMGKPVIKGTRVTVENIVEELASGYSFEEIIKAHPRVTKEDIQAALHYVAQVIKNEKIYPLAS
jgi:uncharacterized protein (DUF433 family)